MTHLSPLNTVLERIENPRTYGKGWRGNCPNGHRSRSTLSVSEGDGGICLVYCHAGCTVDEIVAGLGLKRQDLFVQQDTANMTRQERREYREKVKQSAWRTMLTRLPLEVSIVEIAAVQVAKGEALDEADHARLEEASKLIRSAKVALYGR